MTAPGFNRFPGRTSASQVASLFEEKGLKKEALVILSNLAEMEIEDYRLLRVLANRLRQLEYMDQAISYFEQVLELRPHEPQSYRDLGLAYANNKQYQKSVDALYEIVKKTWNGRFPEIEVIALEEMNQVIAEAHQKGVKLNLAEIDKRFVYEMPVDIRIVLNWDTDNSDMDLWVTDSCGEVCIYSNYSSGKKKKETITLRLTENKETIDIGEIIFEKR